MDNQYTPHTEPEPSRKVSPFADSPYQMPYQQPAPYRPAYETPVYCPPAPKVKKPRSKTWLWALLTVIIAIGCVAGTAAAMSFYWNNRMAVYNAATANRLTAMQQQLDDAANSKASGHTGLGEIGMTPDVVYAKNVSAVVAVISVVSDSQGYYENFGSGFFISSDGYVVTNCHVVEGSTEVYVLDHLAEEYPAKLIGYDATNDIALLKVDADTEFPCVQIGSSDALVVGERVAAIGNPLGELTSTLTVGYVSAKDRVVTTDGSAINMLQTDAAINSGNSGGPLFNMKGEAVGIITAKYSGMSSSGASIEGIGFAIPMDDVIGMIEDLRDYGYVRGALLGVYVRDVSPAAVNDGLPAGAFVESTVPGNCAEAAGVLPRDIIVNLGGYAITNTTELTRYLRKFEGGQTTTITVYRAGQYIDLMITLDEKPQPQTEPEVPQQILTPEDEGFEDWYEDFIDRFFGFMEP